MNKKLIIPLLVLIGISANAFGQTKSSKEKRGDKYYFVYFFEKAIERYNDAKVLTTEGQRRLAESYRNMDKNVEAEKEYATLVNNMSNPIPEDYYIYAMVLKTNGKQSESITWMNKFAAAKPNDLRARDYMENKDEFTNFSTDDGKYKVDNLSINTDASDFGTNYYKNKMVFSSSRSKKLIAKKYNWTRQPFLNMYVAEVTGDTLKSPEIFDKGFNAKMHEGPASFSNDGNFMAFTKNDRKDKSKDKIVELQIYFSTLKDKKWSTPESFILNDKGFSVGHPSLTSDGNTMYFTSDMPNGFGGADIYRITKDATGKWGTAENLGDKVNTEGDEMFPFFEEQNEVLFFTSNGRYGLGGLDVFICTIQGNEIGKVYNAGSPLNTTSDDFAFVVDSKLKEGYVSSNRSGGQGNDDIYTVDLLKALELGKKIQGIAKDKNNNAIPAAFITLYDDQNDMLDTVTVKSDGAYTFYVETDKNFKLIGEKENYLKGDNFVGTFGTEFVIIADLILLQKEETVAEIIVPQTLEAGTDLGVVVAFNPKNIYFDYDKFNIRPDAEKELAKIIKIMNEHPRMVVELRSHTDCRATVEYNQILSEKRAVSTADYIKKRITKPERIYGKGYGEKKPVNGCACEGTVVSECEEDEHQMDRRTEFIIVSNTATVQK